MLDAHDKKTLLQMWREIYEGKPTAALIRRLRSHARSYKFNPTPREAIVLEALADILCGRDRNLADLVLAILPKEEMH
ncbi:MAG: hypothetical protein CL524_01125 [Aequorivita sp.]|nr:hypothetical protein [Aequorivita sp.]|tara:strand:+ start:814 stop:1047 length:234 start_codon:yes stop_codon:yes gene_type:complete